MSSLASSDKDFSPFNLCLMQLDKNKSSFDGMYYSRSREGSPVESAGPMVIEHKIQGLGNHPISAAFQKTLRGTEAFEKIVGDMNRVELQGSKSAFKSVHDKLSSIFVDLPEKNYGTRMQTLVLVDFDRQVTFVERTRTGNGEKHDWKEQRFEFKIED